MKFALVVVVMLSACGPRKQADAPAEGTTTTETHTVKENGKTKTVTITKTVVPAPKPPDRPADPWPSDPLVKYNVDGINAYRKKHGVAPLKYDAKISAFALAGSKQLANDHTAHAHFAANIKSQLGDPSAMKGGSGFGSLSAENQGDWNGIPQLDPDPQKNARQQIDVTLKLMYDEGPGGGHYENMLNPKLERVGVGIHWVGPKMYLTNDFSD